MPSDALGSPITTTNEFTIDVASNKPPYMLQFKGRPVIEVQGTVVEAQFRFPDGNVLVLVGDHTPHVEVLTLTLIGPDLNERDRVLVGGAYAQGFLAFAAGKGANQVEFCWHDLDLIATVGQHWSWMSLRRRWLSLEDTVPQRDPAERAARRAARRRVQLSDVLAVVREKLRAFRRSYGRKAR